MRAEVSVRQLRDLLRTARTDIATMPLLEKDNEFAHVRLTHVDRLLALGTRFLDTAKSIHDALKQNRSKLPLAASEANALRTLRNAMRSIVEEIDLLCMVSCGHIDRSWAAVQRWDRLAELCETQIKEQLIEQ